MLFKQTGSSSLKVKVKVHCSIAALQKAIQMWKHTPSPAPGHISWAAWAGLCWAQGQVKWELWGIQWRRKVSDPLSTFFGYTVLWAVHTTLILRLIFHRQHSEIQRWLGTVKIDLFPWKAAAGLCLFPSSSTWPVLCLLLLCLICLTVPYTWLARSHEQFSCFWQSLSHLSPQAVKTSSSFPRLALGKQSFRSS